MAYICGLDAGKCLCSSKSELIGVVDGFTPERKLIGMKTDRWYCGEL